MAKKEQVEFNILIDFDWKEIEKFVSKVSDESLVYVGCDSKDHRTHVDFVTVVCVHIDGRHGSRVFIDKRRIKKRMYLHDRLWQEVILTGEAATKVRGFIGKKYLETHVDLNPNRKYKSNTILKDALAYLVALGFNVKEKPEAHSASYAADHYLRV